MSNNINLSNILEQLNQLSKAELVTLNNAVVKIAKAKNRMQSVIKAATLTVGQEVEINQPRHKGQKFTIKKINRTKCIITGPGGTYTCPMSMLLTNC